MEDLTGKRFGRLTVLGFDRVVPCKGGANYYWFCKCDCGKEISTAASGLRRNVKSCGCLTKERHPTKHNMSNTRLYGIWHSMIQRCENPNDNGYKLYGERNIKVCEEWHDSSTFFEWALNNGYKQGLSIDRIDYNGNYEPSNCRWADSITQANNTRRNHYLTIDGITHTIAEWARINGIPYKNVYKRIAIGWNFERAVTEPIRSINYGN